MRRFSRTAETAPPPTNLRPKEKGLSTEVYGHIKESLGKLCDVSRNLFDQRASRKRAEAKVEALKNANELGGVSEALQKVIAFGTNVFASYRKFDSRVTENVGNVAGRFARHEQMNSEWLENKRVDHQAGDIATGIMDPDHSRNRGLWGRFKDSVIDPLAIPWDRAIGEFTENVIERFLIKRASVCAQKADELKSLAKDTKDFAETIKKALQEKREQAISDTKNEGVVAKQEESSRQNELNRGGAKIRQLETILASLDQRTQQGGATPTYEELKAELERIVGNVGTQNVETEPVDQEAETESQQPQE